MLRYLIVFLLCATSAFSQTAPSLYYQFTNPTPLVSTVGGALTGGGTYAVTASDVGTALTWANNNGNYLAGPTLTCTAATVQLLWKSNYETARGRNNTILGWDKFSISFQYPDISFGTPSSSTTVTLNGINNFSWDHLMDSQWHHLAFVYTGTTKQLWIDGQKVFSTTCTAGTISGSFTISNGNNYAKVRGSIDEFAFYTVALSDRQIYQNYLDFQAGNHYTTALAPAYVPGPDSTGTLDTNEFTRNIPRQDQLLKYPAPRYKPGNTLLKNFNWFDVVYLAGQFQPGVGTDQTIIATNANKIQTEMVTNYNYYFNIKMNEPNYSNQQAIVRANLHPEWSFQTILTRVQYTPLLLSQTLPKINYLQNSFGSYLNATGGIITDTVASKKLWRPTALPSVYAGDGTTVNGFFNTAFVTFNYNFSMINENGELFPHPDSVAMSNDPNVVSSKNASGLTWYPYVARKFAENETQSYRDIFMANPRNSSAKFTEYAIDGYPNPAFRFNYGEARKVNTLINGQYYSTGDFYVRYPYNWRYFISAWHGWQWFVQSRVTEIALGDKLFSPFVSAGWDSVEANNIRPAQWLGLLKCMNGLGAEFFYGGFFTTNPATAPDSKNWIWQVSTASYAQEINSRAENYLRSGDVMAGDIPADYTSGTALPGYNFYTGRANTLCTVRKLAGVEKYYIAATIQPISNTGYAPLTDTITINLAGNDLHFGVRRHGSCYIYDKTTTPATFYQLDKWQQYMHPSRWTNNFYFDAEVTDGGTPTITTIATGTDYNNYTTYMKGTGQYRFFPRDTATYWLYVKAASDSAQKITVSIGASSFSMCVDSSNFTWIRVDTTGAKVKFSLLSSGYTLNLSTGTVRVDEIVMSHDSALYAGTVYSCSTTPPPVTCTWQTGTYTQWGNCISGYQYRTRTVTSSVSGCTPSGVMPAAIDSQVCVCSWITGNWSAFGSCIAGYQYRTRTVVSSLSGCVPGGSIPASLDSQACSCSWITGNWGPYSTCNGIYQVRFRTVVSSVSGCTPVVTQPATSDTLNCTIPPPSCIWSVGAWSSWGTCIAGFQSRTRSVTMVPAGCNPTTTKPDTSETQTCGTATPAPANLTVPSKRWYNCVMQWSPAPANSVDIYEVEFTKQGATTPSLKKTYSGVTYKITNILSNTTTYTCRIRALKGTVYSNWSQITFKTTW